MAYSTLVPEGVPSIDGCEIRTRIGAHVIDEGVSVSLEHVFRDRKGNPISLAEDSESSASSESESGSGLTVKVRFKERLSTWNSRDAAEADGEITDLAAGKAVVEVPEIISGNAGVYEVSWALYDGAKRVLVSNSFLLTERSLHGDDVSNPTRTAGPPSIREIQTLLMDSAVDNPLLKRAEFSDDQLMLALSRPVEEFASITPPVMLSFTTKSFPWRSAWADATIGYLLQSAAHRYRRNDMPAAAGGMEISDMAKDNPYTAASERMLREWRIFLKGRKVAINAAEGCGSLTSLYGAIYGI